MPQILQIEERSKKEIKKIIENARKHPISLAKLFDGPIGDNPNYACYVHPYFRCVYLHEQQPVGWFKHLSISIDKEGELPHYQIVESIMHEFGLKRLVILMP